MTWLRLEGCVTHAAAESFKAQLVAAREGGAVGGLKYICFSRGW